jgi:hypothetical protein
VKVNFIQCELSTSNDVKLFTEMIATMGVNMSSVLEPSQNHDKIPAEPQKVAISTVTKQLARAIGSPKPKLTNEERARVAAQARWAKKRAQEEKRFEKATEEVGYIEVTETIRFDPNEVPTGNLMPEEEIDGRHIIEDAFGG